MDPADANDTRAFYTALLTVALCIASVNAFALCGCTGYIAYKVR